MEKVASKRYFMVGIGGIGMQALADVLLDMGHKIVGSDIGDFTERSRLEAKGAKIIIGEQAASNVNEDIDELIYTSAIIRHFPNNSHPEIARALELGIRISKRSEFVGELMKDKIGITISGTHGKTTTTTLITLILQKAGLNPTALVGAEVKSLRGCGLMGTGEYMVVEACEYDRSFLDMQPKIAILTNIEADHLDYYKDLAEIKEAFRQFVSLVSDNGLIIACGDDENVNEVVSETKTKILKFGFSEGNQLRAIDVEYRNGKTIFKLIAGDDEALKRVDGLKISLSLPGKHSVLDALAAIILSVYVGVSNEVIQEVIGDFVGAKRRFEIIGESKDVIFVDDYAHHPTEIQAMLQSARDYFGVNKRIRVIFQPHQFSRTRLLLNDFANSFEGIDEVLIAPILSVRDTEEDKQSISSEKLAEVINEIKPNIATAMGFEEITKYLNETIKPSDVIISVGAGKNSQWINKFFIDFNK